MIVLGGAALAALTGTAVALAVGQAGAAPQNTSLPSISGAARDGSTLSASKGGWANNPTSYAYQWQRCDSGGGGCQPISGGATGTRYTLTSADIGHRINVDVIATNSSGSGKATARPTDLVKATGTAPANTSAPLVSGTFKEDATLTVDHGGWSAVAGRARPPRASPTSGSGATPPAAAASTSPPRPPRPTRRSPPT
jgi:hypothetical protein